MIAPDPQRDVASAPSRAELPPRPASARAPVLRDNIVDRIRGFALLGILLVNAPFLLTSVDGITQTSMPTWYDHLAGLLTWTLFIGKSYVIFAFLFGYSLTLLLASVTRRGLDPARVYRNRLLALLLIGIVHAVCFFVGDILVVYAMLGTLLLWLRQKPDRIVWRVAGVCLALQLATFLVIFALPTDGDTFSRAINVSWTYDGFLDATRTRATVWPIALGFVLIIQGPLVASLFCVGMLAGRHRWLTTAQSHPEQWRKIRRWGFSIGLPMQLVCGLIGTAPAFATHAFAKWLALTVMYLSAPILSAAYIASIALLPRTGFAKLVETDGQMSLSIYLGESIVMTTLAAGWGGGLFGRSTGVSFIIAIIVWTAMLAFAWAWNRFLGQGPAERVLRWLTYGPGTPSRA